MATPEVLDFAKLLAPIPGDKPTGTDLREDTSPESSYYKIKDARKKASDSERNVDKGVEKAEPPEWRPVYDAATNALVEKTKDLEVVAYLIESLTRLKGFAGVRDGYRLARQFVEQFWDELYPAANDAEVQDRFSQILQLNGLEVPGALVVPVRKIWLTEKTGSGTFNLAHYQQAESLAKVADAKVRQQRIKDGAIALETIQSAVAESPPQFFADLVDDISQAGTELRAFCKAFSDKSGFDAPSSDLLTVFEQSSDAVKDLARDKLAKLTAAVVAAAAEPSAAGSADVPAVPVDAGAIRDREDAFGRLTKIADYFRDHEPQSIIPYALEQVANWGKMSLPELLSELIPEEGPRKNVFKQVGIKPPEPKK